MPEWTVGRTITDIVLPMAQIRPVFLKAIEDCHLDLRLKWFGSRTRARRIAIAAMDREAMRQFASPRGSAEG